MGKPYWGTSQCSLANAVYCVGKADAGDEAIYFMGKGGSCNGGWDIPQGDPVLFSLPHVLYLG